MNATLCDFGSCKRSPRTLVEMRDLKTAELRTAKVCRDHLRDVLSACERQGLYSTITVLPPSAGSKHTAHKETR